MTDKKIEIDGVDVSGCEYYNKINKHTGQYCICELEPNCLYKQVKRLEKALKDVFVSHGKTTEILLRKEQECEELKQALKEIKEIAKNGCYDDCNMPLDELVIILEKISEVIDE